MATREPFSNRKTARPRRDTGGHPPVSNTRQGSSARTGTSVVSARAAEKAWYKRGPVMFGVTAVAAVVFSGIWNPPTTTVHSFTEASDYSASRDAGCTNSGEGCHGSEVEYADFNDYHPDMDCTSCHEYEGVGCIPCHTPREHECAACHDGTMEGASDCVRLADAYPNGHYRETTHTAMGTNFDQTMRAEESGEAQTTCKDCHSRDLLSAHDGVPLTADSPYGEQINCGECHNDVRNDGTTQVLANWEDRSCEACHHSDSASPIHATDVAPAIETSGSAGCGTTGAGCHDRDDLHALHPDSPQTCSGNAAEGEPGCHDLEVEAGVAQVQACGGGQAGACHLLYRNELFGHENDREVHAPETSYPARQLFEGVPCGSCHDMGADGRSLQTEHALATSARTLGDDTCRNCHNHDASQSAIADQWTDRDTGESCSTCHDGSELDAAHEADLAGAHDSSAGSEGCADSGIGCHDTASLAQIRGASGIHDDCLVCHDRTATGGNLSYTPGATTCGESRDCHSLPGSFVPATGTHPGVNGNDAAHTAGQTQSTARLADAASGLDVACATCHRMALSAEHTRPNSAIRADACVGCHNYGAQTAAVVADDWSRSQGPDACAACHDGARMDVPHADKDTAHVAIQIGHTGEPSDTGCARGGCHVSADVRIVHRDIGCDIDGCHTPDGDIAGSRKLTCGGDDGDSACHVGDDDHHVGRDEKHFATELDRITGESAPGSCAKAGCHETTSVITLHITDHCSTAGCHVEGGPTYLSCGGPEGAAGCHAGSDRHSSADEKHLATELDRITGEPAPGSCAKAGCHDTTDVRELHVTDHCYAAGCHVEGGPTYMSCGGPEGAAGCHAGSDRHANIEEKHVATELASDGTPTAATCVKSGCHPTADVRELHSTDHCYTAGCHVEGGPTYMSCGGTDDGESCHGPSQRHDVNHSADMTGTVDGITYGPGENVGCFDGCHATGLTTEHRTRLNAGQLEGGGVNTCSICHWHEGDAGNNTYANVPAVENAIAAKDRRCIACHSSGSGLDGPLAVAPPPSATCTPTVTSTRELASVTDAGETIAPCAVETTISPESSVPTVAPAPALPVSEVSTDASKSVDGDPLAPAEKPAGTDAQPEAPEDECTFDSSAESTVTAGDHGGSVCLSCHTIAPTEPNGL